MSMDQIVTLAARFGLTLTITDRHGIKRDETGWEHNSYIVRISRKSNETAIVSPYRAGMAHTSDPVIADVLASLVLDADSCAHSRTFEEWCGDLGYDTDSRRAERTYNACAQIGRNLASMFADDELEALREACADY